MDHLTNLKLGFYDHQLKELPSTGNVLQAQYSCDEVVVYQAYKESIASWAVQHQSLVGAPGFSLKRTSWIKPNFTWMMYRCGWGDKDEVQSNVLAIRLKKSFWDEILVEAVPASYNHEAKNIYKTRDEWQAALRKSKVVMQWDPDHEPFSNNKYPRRAIQLGLRPEFVNRFVVFSSSANTTSAKEDTPSLLQEEQCGLISIEDISDFVRATKKKAFDQSSDKVSNAEKLTFSNADLLTPVEAMYPIPDHLSVYDTSRTVLETDTKST